MSSYGPKMDVKVLYTLDSSPHHTMVARLGRSIPVEVTIPSSTPLSPLHSNGYYASPQPRQVRFGRITLKACLSAVCMASPELLPDDKRDYIIYAVDPEETFRANQQTTPPRNSSSRRSPSLRDHSDAGPSKMPLSSPARPKDASAASILVGKGFFNWALEEQGDGETTVTGRVRSDGRRLRYDNGREYEEDVNILEVIIKLKESQARSKDKYFNLVRGMSSHTSADTSSRPAMSSSSSSSSSFSASSRPRVSRPPIRSDLALHSEPDYPVSSRFDNDSPVRQSSSRFPAQLRSGSHAELPVRVNAAPATSKITPATAIEPTVTAVAAAAASAASNPQTLQLLSLLHSLQQRSTQSAPEPAQQAQLETLLQQVAQALGTSASSTPAATDMASLADNNSTPSDPTERDPAQRTHLNKAPSHDPDSSLANASRKEAHEEPDRVCYNCGSDLATAWRLLKFPAGSLINHPAAEKPASSSSSSGDDSAADTTEWMPRYAGKAGPIETDANTRWSACNACGLYYLKWNNSRPEYVWRKEHATKAYKERKAQAEANKRKSITLEHDTSATKRPRVEIESTSPAYSTATPKDHLRADGASPFDASTPASASGRKSSMPRTLSEACQRDADKLESQRVEKQRDVGQDAERERERLNRKRADREYVLDESTGKYRSRRSMRENPQGNRPGRPKGSGSSKAERGNKRGSLGGANSPNVAQSNNGGGDSQGTSLSDRVSDSKQSHHGQQQQQQNHFRAPLPPQSKPAQPRTVNFAQSSPVRPSMNAGQMQPNLASSHQYGGMLQSPSRDVRFRVPSYLMNSSPGTMMDTLMSEADFDFGSLPSMDMMQTPGTLLGNMGGRGFTPLRRSPRKNPHGTLSGQNPYASPGNAPPSPTFHRHASRSGDRSGPVLSSNDSPVTRSRTKSGQDVLHPALFSSSDDLTNADTKSSSTVTSPASPSLKSKTKKSRAASSTQTGTQSKAQSNTLAQTKGTTAARKASLTSTNRSLRATSAQSDDADEDDSEDNGPEARLVKGPYQSTGGGSSSREGSVGIPSCPRSPSLARSVRKFARNVSAASASASPVTHWSMQNGRAKLASLDLPPSSPCFDHPTADSSAPQVDEWGRTPSMREIFPTPSDLDWPSDASPEKNAAIDQAGGKPTSTPTLECTSGKEVAVQNWLQVPSMRRRPLPATVEDASSSVSGSSPADSEDSPNASETNLFDLLEDPYGILAASGIGIDATGGLAHLEVAANSGAQSEMTPTSNANTVSADAFNEVQLHQAKEFGLHLNEFQHSGSVGTAAHVGGEAGASVLSSQPKPSSIADSPKSVSTSPKILLTPTLDATFLSSLPPELSSIFASPKKPLPAHIFDMLTSPRKPKPTASSSPSSKAGQAAASPSASGAMVPYGEFDTSAAAEADFSALFNNPDIQAMLAEFGTSA